MRISSLHVLGTTKWLTTVRYHATTFMSLLQHPPGGMRLDETAFLSTEQQSSGHTTFLQRNSKRGDSDAKSEECGREKRPPDQS